MLDGIDHIGELCKRVRESHHLKPADIKRRGDVDTSTISTFENTGNISQDAFLRYLTGLDLNSVEFDLLLYRFFYPAQFASHHEEKLDKVRFNRLKAEGDNLCYEMIDNLKNDRNPAYIRDELWFIHALNQPLLDLFGITHADLNDRNWASWHVIGTKYCPGSKVALAHGANDELYFPRALKQFFVETAPFFFTAQMKALRNHLWDLSDDFRWWWRDITQLGAPYKRLGHMLRTIKLGSQWIDMRLSNEDEFEVDVGEGLVATFTKVAWLPRQTEDRKILDGIVGSSEQQVLFAADFTQDYNDWPEVKQRP